jgi:uncharacterized protein DUF2637
LSAAEHGQAGWRALAFPISVNGLEIVTALFLVTQRRSGRRVRMLPWVALGVGTAASLAANVAVGGHDLIGRATVPERAVLHVNVARVLHDGGTPEEPRVGGAVAGPHGQV